MIVLAAIAVVLEALLVITLAEGLGRIDAHLARIADGLRGAHVRG